ncbi:hypothetical protein Ddye_016317 [Dipteronia dyeriana]|uniref:DUF1985 domain-containing protein n=1 Tax=Dipteronia dyeriana TaxID=168575 RepID=A0AAD9WZY7_9ROSI|nr:hypothetical protein Ddye_016317 [Dipteronia dyeriana]
MKSGNFRWHGDKSDNFGRRAIKSCGVDEDVWKCKRMRNRLKELLNTPEEEWYKGKLTRHNHFDSLSRFDDKLNQVPVEFTVEDRRRFMVSCFRYFMTMHRQLKFSGGVIYQMLLREVHNEGQSNEIWFMLGIHDVRFSKVEFYLIIGLWLEEVPDITRYASMDNGKHQRYFAGMDEILFEELRVVVNLDGFQQAYDSVKLCLLYMLKWIIMCLDERVKTPVWQFQLVKDLNTFDAFPWGSLVYNYSIFSFKHVFDMQREWFERCQQTKGTDVHML